MKIVNSGFTLIELMITLVVLSIVAAIAAPSMQRSFDSYRIRKGANAIATGLNSARAQALNHHSVGVTIDDDYTHWKASYSETTTGKTTQVVDIDLDNRLTVDASDISDALPNDAGGILKYYRSGRSNLSLTVDVSVSIAGSCVSPYIVTLYKSGSVDVNRGDSTC